MLLGTISILAGVLLALGQWDYKRLLAYHSISQVGYIILGLGLASPLGIMGGLFHLFNHAIFKSLLFLNAGAVETTCGTRNLKELGGLNIKQPFAWASSFMAALSISGIPPFNGFWSKLFIILACIQAGRMPFAVAAILGSILTLASFMKVQKYASFDKLPDRLQDLKEPPLAMLFPMIILVLLCFFIGIFHNQFITSLLNPAVRIVLKGTAFSSFFVTGGK
jgi:multicomponent Na+:H+ antiporter subunit D